MGSLEIINSQEEADPAGELSAHDFRTGHRIVWDSLEAVRAILPQPWPRPTQDTPESRKFEEGHSELSRRQIGVTQE